MQVTVIEDFARFIDGLPWAAITVTSLLALFALALIHELGHAVVALTRVPGDVTVTIR